MEDTTQFEPISSVAESNSNPDENNTTEVNGKDTRPGDRGEEGHDEPEVEQIPSVAECDSNPNEDRALQNANEDPVRNSRAYSEVKSEVISAFTLMYLLFQFLVN